MVSNHSFQNHNRILNMLANMEACSRHTAVCHILRIIWVVVNSNSHRTPMIGVAIPAEVTSGEEALDGAKAATSAVAPSGEKRSPFRSTSPHHPSCWSTLLPPHCPRAVQEQHERALPVRHSSVEGSLSDDSVRTVRYWPSQFESRQHNNG